MKNRASSHLLILLLIIGFQVVGYLGVYRAALLRGYEPSVIQAVRDFCFYIPLIILTFWLSRKMRYAGNWTLLTAAILLFSVGQIVQYRLYSDPEFRSRPEAAREARARKTQTLRERYINQYYDAEKRQVMGMPETPPAGQTGGAEAPTQGTAESGSSRFTVWTAFTSSYTWITVFAFVAFGIAFWVCVTDKYLALIQKHSFLIALLTLIPLSIAVASSSAGKVAGMTPWEPSKIPFLLGFAGILTALYKNLAQTYWGMPRVRDMLPLMLMAAIPFIPFFALSDFGQLMVFTGAYSTLYLVAVRRWPQLLLFVGTLVLGVAILMVSALPPSTQEQVPLLSTLSRPIQPLLPDRIKQRFYLWIDGFNPPSPEIDWWRRNFNRTLERDAANGGTLRQRAEESPASRRLVNIDVWFGDLAYQPAQAAFGIAAGGVTGRGLGLGFAELVPESDTDYIYAAIAEEMGIVGGAVVILALIILVHAGMRTAIEARDMFTKLCAAGLTAFIGFQAAVNVGGITRALPMTGITFPFVSHGGFSLITSFAMLGMLMAFSHRNARDAQVAAAAPASYGASRPSGDYQVPEAVQ